LPVYPVGVVPWIHRLGQASPTGVGLKL